MADRDTQAAATALLDLCKAKKLMVATAESCTGGLVAAALTDIAGSSAVVERGFSIGFAPGGCGHRSRATESEKSRRGGTP